jgi:hypothetical protein
MALIVVVVAAVTAGVIALASGGSSSAGDRDPAWAHGHEVPNALHEAANESREAHEAKFDRDNGKEGRREGPSSPSAEQVADRAYPRSYVDDRLARKAQAAGIDACVDKSGMKAMPETILRVAAGAV